MLTLLAQNLDIRSAGKAAELPGFENISSSDAGFSILFSQILTALLAIVGLILLIYLLWAGIDWITSGGDSSKVASARNKITQAIIGLIIFSSVFAIIYTIESMFGLDLLTLNPASSPATSKFKDFEKESGVSSTF